MENGTTNWNELLNNNLRSSMVEFIKGNASGRQIERQLRNTEFAGQFRQLIRSRGVEGARKLGVQAARRRNLI